MHHHFFHQKNPSKEIHFCTIKFSIKKIHQRKTIICTIKKIHHNIIILFHQFFSSLLRGIICGGKSEQRTMHKAPHRIYLVFFHPTVPRGQMLKGLGNETAVGCWGMSGRRRKRKRERRKRRRRRR